MEKRTYETPLGEIWLKGRAEAFDSDLPLVLGLPGAIANPVNRIFQLPRYLPQAAVLLTQLPGHTTPPLETTSIGAFAFAYDHVVKNHFANRRVVVCGESAGGLVAMAMSAPGISRLVLDPPLRTAKLWPVIPKFRQVLNDLPEYAVFLDAIMGVTAEAVTDRDYTHLISRPAQVLVGGIPLMPERPLDIQPSFVDEPERQLLRDSPSIQLTVVEEAGHLILGPFPTLVAKFLGDILAS